jgi:hypothetical protein
MVAIKISVINWHSFWESAVVDTVSIARIGFAKIATWVKVGNKSCMARVDRVCYVGWIGNVVSADWESDGTFPKSPKTWNHKYLLRKSRYSIYDLCFTFS